MFEEFLKSGTYLKSWSPKTVRSYRQAWNSFQRFQQSLRDSPASGETERLERAQDPLSKASLEAWVMWMRESMSPGGCNCYIRAMNSYCTWLHDERGAPSVRLKLLRTPPGPIKTFNNADIRDILALKNKRLRVLCSILIDTGIRIDEALNLKWADIDFDNLLLIVKGKGSKVRKLPFSLELRKILWRFWDKTPGYVIRSRTGTRLMYRNVYREVMKRCGKSPHAFRHTWATQAVRRGVPLPIVQRILGHASIQTTMRYVHMQTEDLSRHHLSPLVS